MSAISGRGVSTYRGVVRSVGWFMVAALVASIGLARPAPAKAACSTEQAFFRQNTAGATVAAGTQNDIYVRDATLEELCSAYAERHSTAHVRGPIGQWAEVGWVEKWTAGSNKIWRAFWEWSDGGGTIVGGFLSGQQITCCGWYRFKVEYLSSAGGWQFFIDPGADGGFVQIGGTGTPGFTLGRAMGETGRRPDYTTGLKDHHRTLKYKTCSSCAYQSWPDNSTYTSPPSGWYYSRTSSTEYKVCATSSGCPNP
jgi:hypothetical protein